METERDLLAREAISTNREVFRLLRNDAQEMINGERKRV